ncbi:ABC transporter ATP-binding protein [Spirochaeta isovalerica]|uniref:Iron complex transport system ATP-binding protein n=1 Tax=Spirochaeta isovalerica TaxID=150 RepID=A0A841R993_9SPIO|nr:ABC transporter ATP-binding protein [Spirochaeta isovalerica]MBB6481894.1 iron complex transport system ATP-binding protein [Spirochaeta isovalerica]
MKRLETENLDCGYSGRNVLENINLHITPGSILGLIGPNGAGKSTLLNTLARMIKPKKGKVILASKDLWKISSREAASTMAFTPQDSGSALPLTIRQFVALGRAPHRGWLLPFSCEDRDIVEDALEKTGLSDLAERCITELSGGEQQRAALARVLAQEPEVLLLDEPTSHLDIKYQTEILDLVANLAHDRGISVIISIHDLNTAALYSDHLALVGKGGIASYGTPADVLKEEIISEVYDIPVIVTSHPLFGTPMVMPGAKSRAGQKIINL